MKNKRSVQEDIQELSDAAKILDKADVRDAEYFKDKWTEFLERRDWSTDTFKKDHKDLREEIRSIENNIKRIQEDIEKRQKQRKKDREEYNNTSERKIQDLESKTMYGRFYPSLGNLKDSYRKEVEDRKRMEVWKAFQTMMDRLGRLKMHKVALTFQNKYRTIEEQKTFEEAAQEKMDQMRKELKEFVEKKLNEKTHRLEKATEATRREMKSHRAFLDNFGTGVVKEIGRSNEALDKIVSVDSDTELNELTDENGFGVDLSQKASERDAEKKDFEEAREAAGETELDGEDDESEVKYRLKHKSLEEKHEVLQEMAEEENLLEMTPQEVADMTDLTRVRFVQQDGILDQMEEEYGTRFGIDA